MKALTKKKKELTTQRNIPEELQLTLQTEVKSGHLLSLDIAVQAGEFTCDI
jgi:hypothetical protein